MDESRTWQVLGHYRPDHGAWTSLISDSRFFMAVDGQRDRKAELTATIQGLFAPAELAEDHTSCRFPARAAWLAKTLQIPLEDLPQPHCRANRDFLERIAPHEAVLVYPAAAFQGLGAMFGHTLLRIDAKGRSPLISYAVNYSALMTDPNPLVQIWYGLKGGFKGYFTLLPYYQKLNEYKEMEERDVWEYRLDLKPDEVLMMSLHALELRKIASDYYFLDENCALNLLFLIEAGRPSLRLADHFWEQSSTWVVPSATVKLLWDMSLLKNPAYTPSLSRQVDYLARNSTEAVVDRATFLLSRPGDNRKETASPSDGMAQNLAAMVVQYRFSKLLMTQEEFQTRYKALAADNNLKATLVPEPVPPHEGHSVGRVEFAGGFQEGKPFLELGWRPSYHSIDDIGRGYPEGGTLNFLDIKGRYYPGTGSVRVQSAEIMGFGSLLPANPFIRQNSWAMHTGIAQRYLDDGNEHLLYYFDMGMGRSHRYASSGLAYWLAKANILAGGGLKKDVDIGPGIEIGAIQPFNEKWQGHIKAELTYFGVSERAISGKITAGINRMVDQNNCISLGWTVDAVARGYRPSGFVRWQTYY